MKGGKRDIGWDPRVAQGEMAGHVPDVAICTLLIGMGRRVQARYNSD